MYYHKLLYVVALLNASHFVPLQSEAHCPLIWNSKQTLGYANGIQLQVCCNVTSTKIWSLVIGNRWLLEKMIYEEEIYVPEISDEMWPDLQVSNCSDKSELTLGYVEARNGAICKHFRGQTFNIRPRMITMNSWYLVCYETSSNCSQCHLELFCKNDFSVECANSWMSSSVRAITNTSMTVWISIGDRYLFQRWTKIRVSVTDQIRRRHLGTSVKEFSEITYLELDIENLQPNSWYFVEVCTQIDPPKQFLELYNLEKSLNNHSRQMCHRTLHCTKASYKTCSRSSIFVFLTMFYCIIHMAK